MTTTNHLKNFEKLESATMDSLSKTADELLSVEHLDSDNMEYLAKALFCLERYDESIEQFERILLVNDDPEIIACTAITHFHNGNYERAIEYLERGLERDPENERMLSYMMLSFELTGDFKGAVRCGERILRKNPKYTPAVSHLIDCHLELGDYDKCFYYIGKMKYEDHCKKALILFRAKRFEECIKEARQARTAKAYRLAAKACLELGNEVKAVKYLYRSYEKEPNVKILFEISDIYLEINDHQRAIHFLKEALLHDEENAEALSRLAEAYINTSRLHDAIEYAERALEITKKLPCAYLTLAEATFQLTASYEKPLEIIEEGLRENPESAELWAKKGNYSFNDDIYGFGDSYEKALSLNPYDCKIHRTYIFLLLLCEDEEAAKKQYNQMLLFNPLFEKSFDELRKSMFL